VIPGETALVRRKKMRVLGSPGLCDFGPVCTSEPAAHLLWGVNVLTVSMAE
jgi:hypothetical protein